MATNNKVKEVTSLVHERNSNPLNVEALSKYINEGRLSGYIQREGQYSDGKSFAQVFITIDVPASEKVDIQQ